MLPSAFISNIIENILKKNLKEKKEIKLPFTVENILLMSLLNTIAILLIMLPVFFYFMLAAMIMSVFIPLNDALKFATILFVIFLGIIRPHSSLSHKESLLMSWIEESKETYL